MADSQKGNGNVAGHLVPRVSGCEAYETGDGNDTRRESLGRIVMMDE